MTTKEFAELLAKCVEEGRIQFECERDGYLFLTIDHSDSKDGKDATYLGTYIRMPE